MKGHHTNLYIDALSEVVDGLSLQFSHFHHPTILGSLQSILGGNIHYGNHLWSIWSFRVFVGVETIEDIEASSEVREEGIYDRVPGRRIKTFKEITSYK